MGQWISKKTHLQMVDGWRRCWRWFSMQAYALAISLQVGWATLHEDMRESVPGWLVFSLTIAILVAGALGRLVEQTPKEKRTPADGQDGGEVGQ
jgi:hypothetical protein